MQRAAPSLSEASPSTWPRYTPDIHLPPKGQRERSREREKLRCKGRAQDKGGQRSGSREGHHPPPRAEAALRALHRPLPAALGIDGSTPPVHSGQCHSRVVDNLQPLSFLEGQVSLCP